MTGSEIFRGSADFYGILVIPEISANVGRNQKACMGGTYLRNYLTYKDGSPIKIFRILLGIYWGCFCNCFSMKNKSNLWYFGGSLSKIHAKIAWRTDFQHKPKSCFSLPEWPFTGIFLIFVMINIQITILRYIFFYVVTLFLSHYKCMLPCTMSLMTAPLFTRAPPQTKDSPGNTPSRKNPRETTTPARGEKVWKITKG